MTSDFWLSFWAAVFSGALALAAVLRKGRSLASWCFFAGMITLGADSLLGGISLDSLEPEKVDYWQTLAFVAKSFLPGFWLCFSLTYSRGNYKEFLLRWRFVLAAAFLVPIGLAIGFRAELLHVAVRDQAAGLWQLSLGGATKALNIVLLIATVLILLNLENTFRSAVGTMRWRIKFLVLGLGVIFGARIYTRSQDLVYSGHNLALTSIETGALLIGCTLMALAYLRSGFAEIDVYPSHAVLNSTVTVLLAGGYLFVVGVLAQIIAMLGGTGNFQAQAFLVLLGMALLAVLLLSDRLRQAIQIFVSRHFKRGQHDFRKVWTLFAQRMSTVLDQSRLCATAVKLMSETFNVLSVTIWLVDERKQQLVFGASTSRSQREPQDSNPSSTASSHILKELRGQDDPFDLENMTQDWAEALKQVTPIQFPHGGHRICLPLSAGDRLLGVATFADRVNGVPYSMEELDLLKCMGEQVASGLLNLRLTEELVFAKELEAFQTMSAFFVHDLKNTASTLSLMLKNLPEHFDDPAFREDALCGIGNAVGRINDLSGRMGVFRQKLELKYAPFDLNQLVDDALQNWSDISEVELVRELHPLPNLVADREKIHSVFTNLLLNARDAVGAKGQIKVETNQRNGQAILSVTDNGCGMSSEFVKDSLFRPFHTTKKKGIGIGMFQSKMIVEAHHGNIQVESEPDKGSTFRVILPLKHYAP